LGGAR